MLGHPFYWLMHFRFGILHIQRHVDLTSTLFNVHAFITLVCMHANPVTCHHIEMSRKFLCKCLISITIQPDIFWAQILFCSCVLVTQICLMTNILFVFIFPSCIPDRILNWKDFCDISLRYFNFPPYFITDNKYNPTNRIKYITRHLQSNYISVPIRRCFFTIHYLQKDYHNRSLLLYSVKNVKKFWKEIFIHKGGAIRRLMLNTNKYEGYIWSHFNIWYICF